LKTCCDKSGDRNATNAGGRLLQVFSPLTAKLYWIQPGRVPVIAGRPEVAVAGIQRSMRWPGATPWKHFQTN